MSAPSIVSRFDLYSALLSDDQRYRYLLSRSAGHDPYCAQVIFVMFNPSTADAMKDDHTVRKCCGFARAWALKKLTVINLFAERATDPKTLSADPVGPYNDEVIASVFYEAAERNSVVVAAWGSIAHPQRAERVRKVVGMAGLAKISLSCLKLSNDGQPYHPLMLGYDCKLFPMPSTGGLR